MMLIAWQTRIRRNGLIFYGFHKRQAAAMSFMQRAAVR